MYQLVFICAFVYCLLLTCVCIILFLFVLFYFLRIWFLLLILCSFGCLRNAVNLFVFLHEFWNELWSFLSLFVLFFFWEGKYIYFPSRDSLQIWDLVLKVDAIFLIFAVLFLFRIAHICLENISVSVYSLVAKGVLCV